jgi:hypothetical protein
MPGGVPLDVVFSTQIIKVYILSLDSSSKLTNFKTYLI